MATGFECEFAEKVSKGIQAECPICLLVLREPYQATCCGKSFCKRCIHRIKAANQACPTCSEKDFTLFPNKGLQQSLYDFQVYCTHKSKGCGWTGELRELDNHLNSNPPAESESLQGCPFTLIKCPLDCVSCIEGMSRKNYKSHINDNIDKLLGFVMGQAAVIKSVEQENMQLKARLVDIERDRQYLEQRVVKLEKEMKGQLSSSEGDKVYLEQQVAELMTTVSQLIKKFQELEVKNREFENAMKMKLPVVVSNPQPGQPSSNQQYVTGTYKPIGAEFTMTDFEEYKKDNDMWWSSHFYTHPNGYKMCLRVHANGLGSSKGIHLSVFVCLMKGEFDDQLKWPFKGSVTIKLMNQEEDKDHIVQIAKYTRSLSEEFFARVVEEERSSKVWGIFHFLPLAKLRPKYLKNDCIKLCIKKAEII